MSLSVCEDAEHSPAFANVRALGLLTHCVQLQLSQLGLDFNILVTSWDAPLQPIWLSCLLLR